MRAMPSPTEVTLPHLGHVQPGLETLQLTLENLADLVRLDHLCLPLHEVLMEAFNAPATVPS